MLESTQGIVLNYTRYAESSIISHIYTKKLGLQSYMINQVRSKKSKGKTIFLQPLTLVDLDVYHNDKKTIHRIKDFKVIMPFSLIPFESVRRSMAFFIAEVLNKALKQEDKSVDGLYEFLHHSISILDTEINGVQNFHLFFLFRLTQLLGFYPHYTDEENGVFFNMKTGIFQGNIPEHHQYMNSSETDILIKLKNLRVEQLDQLALSGEQRTQFIEKMLDYYHLHLSGFSNIKSFEVLKDIFR